MSLLQNKCIKFQTLSLLLTAVAISQVQAQLQVDDILLEEQPQHGYLNANVGRSPTISDVPQPVSLYGCNNTVVETQVFWDTDNQILGSKKGRAALYWPCDP